MSELPPHSNGHNGHNGHHDAPHWTSQLAQASPVEACSEPALPCANMPVPFRLLSTGPQWPHPAQRADGPIAHAAEVEARASWDYDESNAWRDRRALAAQWNGSQQPARSPAEFEDRASWDFGESNAWHDRRAPAAQWNGSQQPALSPAEFEDRASWDFDESNAWRDRRAPAAQWNGSQQPALSLAEFADRASWDYDDTNAWRDRRAPDAQWNGSQQLAHSHQSALVAARNHHHASAAWNASHQPTAPNGASYDVSGFQQRAMPTGMGLVPGPCDMVEMQMGPNQPITTLLVRNITSRLRQEHVMQVWQSSRENYNFFYMPYDSGRGRTANYAFINFLTEQDAMAFWGFWHGRLFPVSPSNGGACGGSSSSSGSGSSAQRIPLEIRAAMRQGFDCNIDTWRRTLHCTADASVQPAIFAGGRRYPFWIFVQIMQYVESERASEVAISQEAYSF